MKLKTFVLLLLIALLAMPIAAQDDATDAEEATGGITEAGPLTFDLPEGWRLIPGIDGRVLISNTDLEGATDASQLPPDTLVMQLQLIGINRITGLGDDPSAEDIISAMGASNTAEGVEFPEVTVTDGANYTLAQIDISTPESSAAAIAYNLTDATVALVTITTLNAETSALTDSSAIITTLLDSTTFDVETPYLDEEDKYAGIPQSVSEAGFPQLGSPDAPVELREIGSFDCPACAQFHAETLPELLPRIEAGEVLLTYVPIAGTGSIPNGDSAARASICAIGTDVYWQWHDVLYRWQEFGGFAFVYERLQNGAEALGLDGDSFDECYVSGATNDILAAAVQEAQALGDRFSGTPTLIVNGEIVPNNLELINAAIDAALEAAN